MIFSNRSCATGLSLWRRVGAAFLCLLIAAPLAMHAAEPGKATPLPALVSPWDLHPLKVKDAQYSCAVFARLPHDVEAFDYYTDAQHSIKDEKRYAAYNA